MTSILLGRKAIRTLPMTAAPAAGEAIDSWLETVAHGMNCSFDDLLIAVGLPVVDNRVNQWILQLTTIQQTHIATAAAIAPAQVQALTLEHYAGRAVGIDPQTGAFLRSFPWGRGRGSRFCPHCLAETHGRWRLHWRLGWSFACPRHHVLLADACPMCGRASRLRAHPGSVIPEPGRCANPVPGPSRAPIRCGADLSGAAVRYLGADHPVIVAQRAVSAAIATGTADFGVYHDRPVPVVSALADIRALACRVLANATPEEITAVVSGEVVADHLHAMTHPDPRLLRTVATNRPGKATPAYAATVAVGVSAALTILDTPSPEDAAAAASWLVLGARARGLIVRATNVRWGRGMTPLLTAIQLNALAPELSAADQLRYRIGTPLPSYPRLDQSTLTPTASSIPTLLWPEWSVRFAIPGCQQRHLRPALSVALLLVGSRIVARDAATALHSPLEGQSATRLLRIVSRTAYWDGIRAALIALTDYLHSNDTPMDYQRRRSLDYRGLLPAATWVKICRNAGASSGGTAGANAARHWLCDMLSAQSVGPHTLHTAGDQTRSAAADFPRRLTPQLNDQLMAHARQFLTDHGIDEPPTWHPPTELLAGLHMPRPDISAVDIDRLHRDIRHKRLSLTTAGEHQGATLDEVRLILQTHPAPPAPRPQPPTRPRLSFTALRGALPPPRLRMLYEEQGMSLKTIGARFGVSRQTVTRLARDYGITVRAAHRGTTYAVDKDWLYEQHVTCQRSLNQIAAELGMSPANMTRWAKNLGVPVRRPTTPGDLVLTRKSLPAILQPALATAGGWERLQRFAIAIGYPTLKAAAAAHDLNVTALIIQIKHLERDLGQLLLHRAKRGTSMRATDFGCRVATAIHRLES